MLRVATPGLLLDWSVLPLLFFIKGGVAQNGAESARMATTWKHFGCNSKCHQWIVGEKAGGGDAIIVDPWAFSPVSLHIPLDGAGRKAK